MTLNKSKGNMYGFITHTWNPLAGECPHKCIYCSTKSMMHRPNIASKYSGEPRLIESYLKDDLGSDRFIFVCAQNDLFANGVNEDDASRIVGHCSKYPDNQYLFQSKNPANYIDHAAEFPENSLFGTTIESNRTNFNVSSAPSMMARAQAMAEIHEVMEWKTMVTIEPILDFDLESLVELVEMCQPEWVNIGADSKGHNLPEPSFEKVKELIDTLASAGIKIIRKGNLTRLGVSV